MNFRKHANESDVFSSQINIDFEKVLAVIQPECVDLNPTSDDYIIPYPAHLVQMLHISVQRMRTFPTGRMLCSKVARYVNCRGYDGWLLVTVSNYYFTLSEGFQKQMESAIECLCIKTLPV
ncbi:hypothetical protein RF11_16269 [Thelohanellus kitauei]|uniref:Uncharacterized protein n=1 Tax=Thelohanellus kitauei TaxID=669202 RepID=A0A0C2MDD4_THEKT|nr:hypothetical protein RF11_16269 [Thelohanellus kitauei]